MANITVDKFLECVQRSELIPKEPLARALASLKETSPETFDDADRVADKLIELKLLTRWQCDNLLQGKSNGFMLGPFRLLRLLGAGGMSSVYLGEHTLMQVLRAIKVLPHTRVNDSSYLERFRQEAVAAGRLTHPNIVQAYDIGQHKKHHYIVMEYVDGRNLQNLVKETGPVSFDLAANYIKQAADGLAYAHESGLIHRDIKPANLLLDGKGTVKLLDLGLARFVDDTAPSLTIAHDENVLGTADYLAPEQAVDSHGVDYRADIYSLGCTLYFLLTGHPPFPQGTLPQRINAHQTKMPASIYEDRRDAPQALVDVCNRMMAKSAEARYQTAAEVSSALSTWLALRARGAAGESSEGRSGGSRPLPPPRRNATTAVAPPRRAAKPGNSQDTIADMDRETIKGPSSRPQPATVNRQSGGKGDSQTPGNGGAPGSGKQEKTGSDKARAGSRDPGDSGGVLRRSGPTPIPTARALDAIEEEDADSVLFGTSAMSGGMGKWDQRIHKLTKPTAPAPKWLKYAIAAGMVVAIALVVFVAFFHPR